MIDIDPTNVSSTILAEVLGMTRQRVSKLRSEGVIKNNGNRGKYNLAKRLAPQIAKTKDPEKIRELLRDGLNGICTTFEKELNQAIQGATNEGQN